MAVRVLVVDDEESFTDALAYMLQSSGFDVAVASSGHDGLDQLARNGADIVLLDLMLPGMPGTEVCKRLRRSSDVPVIMLTAKDSEVDKVVGFELGADDYVTKPFATAELIARIKAVLRRRSRDDKDAGRLLVAGPAIMDLDRHTATVRDQAVQLTRKEWDLLEALASRAGRVVTRDRLIELVWGANYFGDTKTLDVHIRRLRAKLEQDRSKPQYLKTVRGVGYRLDP